MSDRARDLLRADVLRGYEPPAPGLHERVFAGLARPQRPARGRTWLVQAVAVLLSVMLVGALLLARQGDLTVPAWSPFGGVLLPWPFTDVVVQDSAFVSPDAGWVLVQSRGPLDTQTLFATRDAGRHWTRQLSVPPDPRGSEQLRFWPGGQGELTQLQAPTGPAPPDKGHLPPMTEDVYRTSDGGARWTHRTRTAQPFPASFWLSPDEAWGVSAGGSVLHTADGGQTWSVVADLGASGLPTGPGLTIAFRDPSTGWLTAAGTSFDRAVFITHDGGRTWAGQALPLPPGAAGERVDAAAPVFVSPADGFLAVLVDEPGAGHRRYLLRTADGGRTWSSPAALPDGIDVQRVVPLTATHWLAPAGHDVRETVDGGRTWSDRRVLLFGQSFDYALPERVDARTVVVQVAGGRVIRTADAGRTWTALGLPVRADMAAG